MCEEAYLICEQCENFKNGCQGQTGTFDNIRCPSVIIDDHALVS